jgi:diguanylate cyclase (GGDEF)-like protein
MSSEKEIDVTGAFRKEQYAKDAPMIFAEASEKNLPLTVLIVDLDNFKKLNEKVGHDGGDEVLRILAETMNRNVGHRGHVYRYGGDEFAAILPNHSLDEGAAIAKRLHAEVSGLEHFREIDATVTIGVAAWPKPVEDIQKVFHVADRLLLDGKTRGEKNKVHIAKFEKTEVIAANQWRLTIMLSPENPVGILKHQLLDKLIRACYSQPLDGFGRRYCFPLSYDRSNLLQNLEEGWVGARVESPFADEAKYEISTNGSARLTMTRNYASPLRAVRGDNALLETIRFWPFASRLWTNSLPQMHYFSLRLQGIHGALLSMDISVYPALNLVSRVEEYEAKDCTFLPASGVEGAKELLLQTCHNIVTAFAPPRGVSKDDLHLEYFQRKAKAYLEDVRDHDPKEE